MNPGPKDSFITYNCSGLSDHDKIKRILNKVSSIQSENKAAIFAMQETHLTSKTIKYLNYQFRNYLMLGLYSNYQFAQCIIDRNFVVYDASENSTTYFNTDWITKSNTLSFGVNLAICYDNLSKHFFKTKYLQQIKFSNQIKVGHAQSNLLSYYVFNEPIQLEFPRNNGASKHFVADLSMSVAFPLRTSHILSSIGLNIGYQYYKSGIIRNVANQSISISNGTQVHLDFSGFYFGLHMTIGK
jgi:hypothetical protein